MKRGRTALGCAVTVALFVGLACLDAAERDHEGPREQAPSFELTRIGGTDLRLDEMRGRLVILDFWATWCAPCEEQMPILDELWRDTTWRDAHGDDLMIIGVSVDTDPVSDVADWIDERGFEYPIAVGDQDLAVRYGVFGFPTLVVIDQSGGIHTRHTGVSSRPEIENVLDEMRAEVAAGG